MKPPGHLVSWVSAHTCDTVMYALMNRMQWQLRGHTGTAVDFDRYLAMTSAMTRDAYFAAPEAGLEISGERDRVKRLTWESAIRTGFDENDRAAALWFPAARADAPTVFIFHALMSASDVGYRALAAWFNAHGWSAVFPHLPFHYSRVPKGFRNGALAITADLPRNVEGVRQGVTDARQVMGFLRGRGVREFGIVATSYGGWIASLLTSVESGFRFSALIQPIVDLEHAIWINPGAASIRRILGERGIERGATDWRVHYASPLGGSPLDVSAPLLIVGGAYDRVSPIGCLEKAAGIWPGAELAIVDQGHFGYRALRYAKHRVADWVQAEENQRAMMVNE